MSQDGILENVVDSAQPDQSRITPAKSSLSENDWHSFYRTLRNESAPPPEDSPIANRSKRLMFGAPLGTIVLGVALAWLFLYFGDNTSRVPHHSVQRISAPVKVSTTAPEVSNTGGTIPVTAPAARPAPASPPKAAAVTTEDELARLRTENRRLLALVEVLRARSRTNPQDSAAQSSTPKQ